MTIHSRRPARKRGHRRTDFGFRVLAAWVRDMNDYLASEAARGAKILRVGPGRPPVHVSEMEPQATVIVFESEDGAFKMGFL